MPNYCTIYHPTPNIEKCRPIWFELVDGRYDLSDAPVIASAYECFELTRIRAGYNRDDRANIQILMVMGGYKEQVYILLDDTNLAIQENSFIRTWKPLILNGIKAPEGSKQITQRIELNL